MTDISAIGHKGFKHTNKQANTVHVCYILIYVRVRIMCTKPITPQITAQMYMVCAYVCIT